MIFGKIDYLNLLPFHIFLKKSNLPFSFKKSIEYKKGVPSKLNRALKAKKIDAAVISSVESRRKKYKKLDMGIVAKNRVISVLVRKNSSPKLDPASMTSNMLSRVLNLKGEVIIGDRALFEYLKDGKEKFYDLGEVWRKKYNLPFVFARFCYINQEKIWRNLTKNFLKSKIFIPQYILNQYSKSRKISAKDIKWYLKFITYKISKKEKKSLYLYLRESKKFNFNPKEKK